jgi:putative ABC transport system permease protein
VEHVSPYLFAMVMSVDDVHRARYKGNDLYNIDLGGTEEGYAAGGTTMKAGRFFSDQESAHHMPIAVIGEDVGRQLFENADPIDKWFQVDGHTLQVVGVMNRAAASLPGQKDLRVLLPYFTMRKMFPSLKEHMLVVVAYPGMLDQAQDEVRAVLRIERRVPFNAPDNFSISTSESMIERFRQVTGTVALVMVSVTERTREIGIRKAVGARRSDIVVQFLTEAVVLTVLGGIIGLTIGWLISRAAGLIFPNLPTAVPLWTAVSGVLVSVGVGLFFGIWPAGRAARLDPVVALRYE